MGFGDFIKDTFKGAGGSIIGAGASLVGSLLGANSSASAQQANYNAQKEFAQNGIRWRVEDAKAAGIHPLAALGAHTQSFSPVFQGQDYSGLASAGQFIDRAISAKMTPLERESQDLDLQIKRANLDRINAETERIRTDTAEMALNSIRATQRQQQVPSMPVVGSGSGVPSSPDIVKKADEVIATTPDRSHLAGPHVAYQYVRIGGALMPIYEQNSGDSLSDDVIFGLSSKFNYWRAVKRGEIKGPPETHWTPEETAKVKSGNYYWDFEPIPWVWKLKRDFTRLPPDREAYLKRYEEKVKARYHR